MVHLCLKVSVVEVHSGGEWVVWVHNGADACCKEGDTSRSLQASKIAQAADCTWPHSKVACPQTLMLYQVLEERAEVVHRREPRIAEPCHHLLAGSIGVQRRAYPVRGGLAVVIVPFGCSVGFWGHGAIHH